MLKPIKTEAQYEGALASIYELMQLDLQPGSPEGDQLELLTILVRDYEAKHHALPAPHPLDAIRFRLEQSGMTETELTRLFGSRSRKSEILSGRRKLSLGMIRRLHENLKIPAAVLIRAY